MTRVAMRVVATAAAVVVVALALWLLRPGDPDSSGASPVPSASPSGSGPAAPQSRAPAASLRGRAACDPVRPVVPQRIAVPGVVPAADVVTPPRDAAGVPGVPPLTTAGKSVFAWDTEQGIRPGDPVGHTLLNAHTWPDGSALGNRLLDGLHEGDRMVVLGEDARLCYRVTERVEVLASEGLPRYYDRQGPPRLALVVCSGRRLGPGQWEKRTVWFAEPLR